LKHVYYLYGEELVEHWVDNPYHPHFCDFEFFQQRMPIDPSLIARWRKGVRLDTSEEVLKATVAIALEAGTVKASSLEWVTVDTTVQPNVIAHPTNSRLYLKALPFLMGQAKKAGIKLRQSHTRLAKRAAVPAGRYAHAKQFNHMRHKLRGQRAHFKSYRVVSWPCP
jgi:IS5 family transposase